MSRRRRQRVERVQIRTEPTSALADKMLGAPTPPRSEGTAIRRQDVPPPTTQRRGDPFDSFYAEGGALPPPINPQALLDLSQDNAVHGACLNAKATDAAGRGWHWVADDPEQADPAIEAMLDAACAALSPAYPFVELLQQAAWEQEAIGWAAWEVVRTEAGVLAAIYPIPAQTIRATRDPEVWVQQSASGFGHTYFVTFASGRILDRTTGRSADEEGGIAAEKQAAEIILFRRYSSYSWEYGVPTWWCGVSPIREATAIREFNVAWFSSGGQNDFNVHVRGKEITAATMLAEEIKAELAQSTGIPHNKIVTAGTDDMTVETTVLTPPQGREGHFRLRRTDLVNEILMAHQVPPYRIGYAILGGLGGSASTDMLDAYLYGAIKPLQRVLIEQLEQTIFGPDGLDVRGYTFALAELTYDDLAQELDVASRGIGSAMLTPNEGRQQLGWPAVPDQDALNKYYLTSSLVPVEQAGQAPAGGSPFGFAATDSAPAAPMAATGPSGTEILEALLAALEATPEPPVAKVEKAAEPAALERLVLAFGDAQRAEREARQGFETRVLDLLDQQAREHHARMEALQAREDARTGTLAEIMKAYATRPITTIVEAPAARARRIAFTGPEEQPTGATITDEPEPA